MPDSINPFAVLGVDETASADEITAAFRLRATALHPDRVAGGSDDNRRVAEEAMAELTLAYQLLTFAVDDRQGGAPWVAGRRRRWWRR